MTRARGGGGQFGIETSVADWMTYISAGYGRVDQVDADCPRRLCAGSYLGGGTMQREVVQVWSLAPAWNGAGSVADDDGCACGCPWI